MKIALCLSGGGFRATLFHLGAIRRLNELGVLSRCTDITSVSGGSILNGVLSTRWEELTSSLNEGVFEAFDAKIANPVHDFCSKDLRTSTLVGERFNPANWKRWIGRDHSVTNALVEAYAEALKLGVPLSSLPPAPRFIFCATNLESGVNWTFEGGPNGTMGDWVVGRAPTTSLTVAQAVAASSAFPVAFPPLVLSFASPAAFQGGDRPTSPEILQSIPLTDGGVYDNLGIEPVWKRPDTTLLVSDAGHPLLFKDDPTLLFISRVPRCYDITANQSSALRKRWLIGQYRATALQGTYWGIGSEVEDYELPGAQGYPRSVVPLFKDIRTDLDRFTEGERACLENHGYALAEVALRKWVASLISAKAAPFKWPWPIFATEGAAQKALQESQERGIIKDLWNAIRDGVTSKLGL